MAVPPPTRSGSQLCPLFLSSEGSGGSVYVDPSLFTSCWPISLLFPSPVWFPLLTGPRPVKKYFTDNRKSGEIYLVNSDFGKIPLKS